MKKHNFNAGPSILADEVIEKAAFDDFIESFSIENIRALVKERVRDFGGDFLRRFGQEYRWVSVHMLFDESLSHGEVVLCFKEVGEERGGLSLLGHHQLLPRREAVPGSGLTGRAADQKESLHTTRSQRIHQPREERRAHEILKKQRPGKPGFPGVVRQEDYSRQSSHGQHILPKKNRGVEPLHL